MAPPLRIIYIILLILSLGLAVVGFFYRESQYFPLAIMLASCMGGLSAFALLPYTFESPSVGQYLPVRLGQRNSSSYKQRLGNIVLGLFILIGLTVAADSFIQNNKITMGIRGIAWCLFGGISLALIYLLVQDIYMLWSGSDFFIEISSYPFYPGQEAQLCLFVQPKRLLIKQITMKLVCEKIKRVKKQVRRQGRVSTESRNKHETIYEAVIWQEVDFPSTASWNQMIDFTLPTQAHPSRKNQYPHFKWTLKIHFDFANGPNRTFDFALEVQERYKARIENNEKSILIQAWQSFAETHHLNFVSGDHLTDYRIVGIYQGHHLELSLFSREADKIYTLFLLTVAEGELFSVAAASSASFPSEEALIQFLDQLPQIFSQGKLYIRGKDHALAYEWPERAITINHLQIFSGLLYQIRQMIPALIALGGKSIPSLQKIARDDTHPLYIIAPRLIEAVASFTHSLSDQFSDYCCAQCFHRFTQYQVALPDQPEPILYYGCRACHQSRDYYTAENIIAVLDNQMDNKPIQKEGNLYLNWLTHQMLFDFDGVEIIRADDEAVERLAIQIGNDTDPVRQSRSETISCILVPDHGLSSNTLHILKRTFPHLRVNDAP